MTRTISFTTTTTTIFLLMLLIACDKKPVDLPTCLLDQIIYGQQINGNSYQVIYEDDLIVEMISEAESAIFSYDQDGHLVTRTFFQAGNDQVQLRDDITTNTVGLVTMVESWRPDAQGDLMYTGRKEYDYNGTQLAFISCFRPDNITLLRSTEIIWENGNPTELQIDETGINYSWDITYNTDQVNIFNASFDQFMFYDFYDTDFNTVQSLGKNTITSATFRKDDEVLYTDIYEYRLLENGLTDRITFNGQLLWSFQYTCE